MIIKTNSLKNCDLLLSSDNAERIKEDTKFELLVKKWKKNNKLFFFEKKNKNNLLLNLLVNTKVDRDNTLYDLYQSIIDIENKKKNVLMKINEYVDKKLYNIELDLLDQELKFLSFHLNFLKKSWIDNFYLS